MEVQRLSNLDDIDEIATRILFSNHNQARYFDFIAANTENPVSHKYDVVNGSSILKAFLDKLLYSV